MTTNYHTPITTGAAANAATFNSPFGQLDAAMTAAAQAINYSGSVDLDEAMEYAAGGVYNVKAYGAAGDGATDDTTAIQAAVDAAEAAAPATVLFPSGTYVVSGITVDDNVQLVGERATIKQKVLSSTVGTALVEIIGANVRITGLAFNGQKDSQPADGFSDSFNGGTNSTGRAFRAGIKANGAAYTINNIRVDACEFEDIYGACVATQDVDDVVIHGCRAVDCFFELAFLYRSSGTNLRARVTNNTAVDIKSGDGTTNANVVLMSYYSDVVVADNVFYDFERNGVKLEQCTDFVVSGNVFNTNSASNFGAVQTQLGCDRGVIVGNTIYNCQAGITCNQNTSGYTLTVAGNHIDTTGGTVGDGILFGGNGTFDVASVTGNTIVSPNRHGIYIGDGGTTMTIAGNTISGPSNTNYGIYGYLSSGSVTTLSIVGNTITGFTNGAGIGINRTSTYTYTNLRVSDNVVVMSADDKNAFILYGTFVTNAMITGNLFKGLIANVGDPTFAIRDNLVTGALYWGYSAAKVPKHLTATTTWDPGSISDGAMSSTTVSITGAAVGDVVAVGYSSITAAGWLLSGSVTSTDTVTVTLMNKTGGAVDLSSGTLRVDVWQH